MFEYTTELIVDLYYNHDMSQQEIAKYLNTSKMNVSRMMQKAKTAHIVETKVHLPFQLDAALCRQLEKKYGLKNAYVVSSKQKKNSDLCTFLGSVAAYYLTTARPNGKVFGMGVGNTVGKVAEHIPMLTTKQVKVVQLMGGLTQVNSGNPFSITQETCRRLSAEGAFVTSYAIVEDPAMKDMILKNEIQQKGIYSLWEQCDEAYFGIGAIESGTFFAESLNKEQIEKIRQLGAVGDVLGHCFNEKGEFITTFLEDSLVSIPIELLYKIPKRIAVAGDLPKKQAIVSVLSSRIITDLFIDKETAEAILNSDSQAC